MKEKKNFTEWIKKAKPAVFLLPALVFAAVIFVTLPYTAPILKQIPEKLEYIMPVIAEAATVAERRETVTDAEEPHAFFDYQDGVFTGRAYGYGGEISLQVTVKNGRIIDISVLEAPGETEPYFSLAKTVIEAVLKQQTWEVDAISGATFSSRGILGAVQNAITGETVESERPQEETRVADTETFKDPAAYKDGTYTGTAQGFGGPIEVQVTVKKGKIAKIVILHADGETPEYLSKAAAVLQTIRKAGSPNVDTVSGATYSSAGIITAAKRALAKAGGEKVKPAKNRKNKKNKKDKNKDTDKKGKKQTVETPEEVTSGKYADGTFRGSGDGFGGEIAVEVTVKNGKITNIRILSADYETAEYLEKASVLTSVIVKKQSTDVDVISGATYSSNGILKAVNEALKASAVQYQTEHPAEKEQETKEEETTQSGAKQEETSSSEEKTGGEESGTGEEGTETGQTGEEETTTSGNACKDGVYTGYAWCDDTDSSNFRYLMSVRVTVSDGRIAALDLTIPEDDSEYPEDNTPYIEWAKNGRTLKGATSPGVFTQVLESQQAAAVDIVSRATYSSNALIEAIREALSGAME